nr:immunoglobulin light chain junction region [Macaca mulatta]MPN80787.1 immunoglobulin light chain junction region [Macaca mulatta]
CGAWNNSLSAHWVF